MGLIAKKKGWVVDKCSIKDTMRSLNTDGLCKVYDTDPANKVYCWNGDKFCPVIGPRVEVPLYAKHKKLPRGNTTYLIKVLVDAGDVYYSGFFRAVPKLSRKE